ncbi:MULTISPECIES: methionine aminopeptidase [Bacillaceae]|uniref:Methionine aminopeptidase n=1 Tax=Evansella alkalicola TaxID=745819 RepID=A0ABS6JS84_9BACI|nr:MULTISPECIES: methionine aminopeptidase [Bacillaceae]MBU9720569.1 methionine aminopeptidase [Bacillus alkalicola]
MGLLSSITDYFAQRIKESEQAPTAHNTGGEGACPDCHGYGYHMYSNEYFFVSSHAECRGCNGVGSMESWKMNHEGSSQ